MGSRIAMILPPDEHYSRAGSSTITLSVVQYLRHSCYSDATVVLGTPVAVARYPELFQAVAPRPRWWQSQQRGFIQACAARLHEHDRLRHIDVHNQVAMANQLAWEFPYAEVTLWLYDDPLTLPGVKTARQRRHLLTRIKHVICASAWIRQRFLQEVTDDLDRVLVLPSLIDPERVGFGSKQRLIVFAGRNAPDQAALEFAQAAALALPQLPGWRACVMSARRSTALPYAAAIEKVAAASAGRIDLVGVEPRNNVLTEFRRAAIAVLPWRREEPCARIALEALAAGCAIIAGERAGLAEVVGDEGLLLAQPDTESLAEAMIRLASDDLDCRDRQWRAITRFAQYFDSRKWAERLDSLRQDCWLEVNKAPHRSRARTWEQPSPSRRSSQTESPSWFQA